MEAVRRDPAKLLFKWSNHTTSFVQTIQNFYKEECMANVTLACEGKWIKAHKLILSASSEYFKNILHVAQEWDHPIIYLDNVKFKDLQYVLTFMYHGELHLPQDRLPQILALGESLQVRGLGPPKSASGEVQHQGNRLPNNVRGVQQLGNVNQTPTSNIRDTSMQESRQRTTSNTNSGSNTRSTGSSTLNKAMKRRLTISRKRTMPIKRPRRSTLPTNRSFRPLKESTPSKISTPSQEDIKPNENAILMKDSPLPNGNSRPGTSSNENAAPKPITSLQEDTIIIEDDDDEMYCSSPNSIKTEVSSGTTIRLGSPSSQSDRSTTPIIDHFGLLRTNLRPTSPYQENSIDIPIKTSPQQESSAMDAQLNLAPVSKIDCPGDCFGFLDANLPDNNDSLVVFDATVVSPAPNAFMLFTKEFRTKLTEEYPGESNAQISTKLAAMWKNMIPENKRKYYEEEKRLFEEYKMEKQSQLTPQQPQSSRGLPIKIEDDGSFGTREFEKREILVDHAYVKAATPEIVDVIDLC